MNMAQMDKMKSNVAYEYLAELKEHEKTIISGVEVELYEITDSIDEENMREAMQWALQGDMSKLNEFYVEEIKGRM